MVDGSSASVAQLLQDVIGKEQHLRPDCGRLREIHARIAREVQDAKVRPAWTVLDALRHAMAVQCPDVLGGRAELAPPDRKGRMAHPREAVQDDNAAVEAHRRRSERRDRRGGQAGWERELNRRPGLLITARILDADAPRASPTDICPPPTPAGRPVGPCSSR